MLKIQQFISCFATMQEASVYLATCLNISVQPFRVNEAHTAYMFKLGLQAERSNPLVRETNCLVIDNHNEVLAKAWDYPLVATDSDDLPSEFNLGHNNFCMEIPDGETVVVYNIDNEWFISTGSHPEGSNYLFNPHMPGYTYEGEIKGFLARRYGAWDKPFKGMESTLCYVFKYVDPYRDENVMPPIAKDMYLMGIIDRESGEDLDAADVETMAAEMSMPMPNRGHISGGEELSVRLRSMPPLLPGLVLRNAKGNRMTVLNPIYKTVRNAVDAGRMIKPIHMAKILQVCRDKTDLMTVIGAYENFDYMLRLLWAVRTELWGELSMLWNDGHGEDLREFAALVRHHPLNFLLFMMRNGEIHSLNEALKNLKPHKLVDCAESKWKKEFEQASKLLKFIKSGGNPHAVEEEGASKEEDENSSIPYGQEGD